MDEDAEPKIPASGQVGNDADEHKSWAHQLTVGAALIVVSLFFLPEGFGALNGDGGGLFRADDGEPDIFFGSALLVVGGVMLIGGAVFVVKGLRKRKAELDGGRP